MSPSLDAVAADLLAGLVAGALRAPDPAAAGRAALDALRAALGADETILARALERWSRPVVRYRSPAGDSPRPAIDLDGLGGAFDSANPVELPGTDDAHLVLALALRPRDDVPWVVALAKAAGGAWPPDAHRLLAAAAPTLTLVLEHTLLREQASGNDGGSSAGAAMRGRFLALLSHELRNPLAPILMWTSTLRRLRRDDAEIQRATQAIEHAVGLARLLIEELSDVSRIERGILELQRHVFDFRDTVREALDQARGALAERQLTLVEELPAEAMPVAGDPTRLRQVVSHLLTNAARFADSGGTVTVSLARDDGRVALRVSDSGPGLPDVIVPQLFTPFVQGPNAHGGLGVGLALAQQLLALQGGTIEATARGEHGGATFVARLPLQR